MSVLSAGFKFRVKRAAKAVGLLNWVNRIEYAYGNRIDQQTLGFFRQFIPSGALCFDVGAHFGRKTMLFRQLGASVVAIEPIAHCAEALRATFTADPDVTVVEAACGKEVGLGTLRICPLSPQNSTLSAGYEETVPETDWEKQDGIAVTTLDSLIAQYGTPVFCKIDAEGYELPILEGLNHQISAISFEFHRSNIEGANACLQRLRALGYASFNFAKGNTPCMALSGWHSAQDILRALQDTAEDVAGDIYAHALIESLSVHRP